MSNHTPKTESDCRKTIAYPPGVAERIRERLPEIERAMAFLWDFDPFRMPAMPLTPFARRPPDFDATQASAEPAAASLERAIHRTPQRREAAPELATVEAEETADTDVLLQRLIDAASRAERARLHAMPEEQRMSLLRLMRGETGPVQADRMLLDWIERHGGSTTVRELTHGVRSYRGNAEQAAEDLEKLVQAGRLVGTYVAPSRKGGRPRFEYRIARVAKTPLRGPGSGGSGTGDSGDTDSNANPEDDWGSL